MSLLTETQVFNALRERYAAPEWALLPQVANTTGAYRSRYADAVAVSLWPSRGFEVHGFEIKVTRGDWLRELKNPGKADDFVTLCDGWWLAVGEKGIVKPDELPRGWGLLEPHGESLRATATPERKSQPEIPRRFWVAMIRRAWESMPSQELLQLERKRGFADGMGQGKLDKGYEFKRLEDLKKAVEKFEIDSGVRIETWNAGEVGQLFKAFRSLRFDGLAPRLRHLASEAQAFAALVETLDAK